MRISVLIPTYNSATFIAGTIDSVLRQTVPADEIIVLDDGSEDHTVTILKSYGDRIMLMEQPNRGVAAARNRLCASASGDLLAFLDHDDVWHPAYLELQSKACRDNPKAAGFFTQHHTFLGNSGYEWTALEQNAEPEILEPVQFVTRYNSSSGTFYTMSVCCLPQWVLARIGEEPFTEAYSGVDDCHVCNLLPLYGPIVFTPVSAVAYRVTPRAQSSNQLRNFRMVASLFKDLEPLYLANSDKHLLRAFYLAFAGKQRRYGKTLMGAGNIAVAREEFRRAIFQSLNPASIAKSLSLLVLSYLPPSLQPAWPSASRQMQSAAT